MQPLYDRRKALYSKKRTVKDETALAHIREECTAISEALKPVRKALRMCDAIAECSQKVREAARMPLYPVPKRVQRGQKHREDRLR